MRHTESGAELRNFRAQHLVKPWSIVLQPKHHNGIHQLILTEEYSEFRTRCSEPWNLKRLELGSCGIANFSAILQLRTFLLLYCGGMLCSGAYSGVPMVTTLVVLLQSYKQQDTVPSSLVRLQQ